MVLFYIAFVAINLVLIYQDFKERKVSLIALLLLLTANVFFVIYYGNLSDSLMNFVFISLILLFLFLYVKIRFKNNLKLLHALGLGDIIFMLIMTLNFDLKHYLVFFNSSILFALIISLVLSDRKKNKKIPLISFFGAVNVLFAVLSWLNVYQFFNL